MSATAPIQISVLIPVYNEEENILPLCQDLKTVMTSMALPYEVILIDDGSQDQSAERLRQIALSDPAFKVIRFRRNFGQTAAIMAGIEHAQGAILIPMDSDRQNDPHDIPRLLEKLQQGYDVVSGWRKHRQDNPYIRTWPSRMANWLISNISGVHLHDYGCTIKAYRREVIEGVRLYGEMHRFIPIYAHWMGASVTEIEVTHHPRTSGISKYGLNRIFKVILDLIVVQFLGQYFVKPIYLFGSFGLVALLLSAVSGCWALYLKFFTDTSLISTPLPLIAVMCLMTGIIAILLGLVAEMVVRTYFESQGRSIYLMRETINLSSPPTED
ncbi:MAG: glycosyltransferase family 2 protein [Magnetococcales bacterium]|nr:glycosyltransferase family 2 protein [Magnetococcales bacterium]NGZ05010.1 glycosyltransferase family 2 protein [Magnetococcales bacterium]